MNELPAPEPLPPDALVPLAVEPVAEPVVLPVDPEPEPDPVVLPVEPEPVEPVLPPVMVPLPDVLPVIEPLPEPLPIVALTRMKLPVLLPVPEPEPDAVVPLPDVPEVPVVPVVPLVVVPVVPPPDAICDPLIRQPVTTTFCCWPLDDCPLVLVLCPLWPLADVHASVNATIVPKRYVRFIEFRLL